MTAAEVIALPREKDDTDTVFAAREAVRRGFDDFLLLGAAGGRLDHTLVDDFSDMEVVGGREVLIGDSVPYFSLLNISGTARGVDITGAKYPLSGAEISADYQYGISNEVLPGQTAAVKVREGNLLLIRVYRDQEEIE